LATGTISSPTPVRRPVSRRLMLSYWGGSSSQGQPPPLPVPGFGSVRSAGRSHLWVCPCGPQPSGTGERDPLPQINPHPNHPSGRHTPPPRDHRWSTGGPIWSADRSHLQICLHDSFPFTPPPGDHPSGPRGGPGRVKGSPRRSRDERISAYVSSRPGPFSASTRPLPPGGPDQQLHGESGWFVSSPAPPGPISHLLQPADWGGTGKHPASPSGGPDQQQHGGPGGCFFQPHSLP